MLQDKNGDFWFATWEGIIRYDGKTFPNITLAAGLRRFHVFSVLEARAGNLWIGTDSGISRYAGKSFTSFSEQ